MVPAALWAALAVGLQLWTAVLAQVGDSRGSMGALASHAHPAGAPAPGAPAALSRGAVTEAAHPTYAPESGNGTQCQPRQYYDKRAQMYCSMCPPGHFVQSFCTKTSDTVCAPCEDSTYTQLCNWVSKCLSCSSRCSSDQEEVQSCTREQNRICTCRSGWYCMLRRQEGCQLCVPLRKCLPSFGVAKQGTATSNVVCTPCAPGTFSNTTSSKDPCRPHRNCSSVAIPGNASMDTVCGSLAPALTVALGPAPNNIALPIGLIVGVTALGLVIIVLVSCVIMTRRKKKPSCLRGEAKVPHLPADKARNVLGPEQQHLLTTAPSSSSSSLESSASAAFRRVPAKNQPEAPGTEKASGAGGAPASCASSAEPSPGSCGTQVNVTCIVNVCSSSDHGSQCPSQASSMTGDMDASPSGSPKDEQVPFSKEECPFQSQPGSPETLQQNSEEKPLPLGVQDAGMKLC
ncbi:tumor necrosis factor receptor superfamily member 1B isoform 3-T3 [Trichechus inunguis]